MYGVGDGRRWDRDVMEIVVRMGVRWDGDGMEMGMR